VPPLRIDGSRKFASIKLMGGEVCDNGPFWLTLSAGDLQQANTIFVTNGDDVWPVGATLGLYATAEAARAESTAASGEPATT
jgi:hypothetical protein